MTRPTIRVSGPWVQEPGEFHRDTRARFMAVIERLKQDGAEGVLLAGRAAVMSAT